MYFDPYQTANTKIYLRSEKEHKAKFTVSRRKLGEYFDDHEVGKYFLKGLQKIYEND